MLPHLSWFHDHWLDIGHHKEGVSTPLLMPNRMTDPERPTDEKVGSRLEKDPVELERIAWQDSVRHAEVDEKNRSEHGE